MVAAEREYVDPVRSPGHRRRVRVEVAAERFPAAPATTEPFVVEMAVVADNKRIEAGRGPGRHADPVGAEPAEALPAMPRRRLELVERRLGADDASPGVLVEAGGADVLGRGLEQGLRLALGQRRLALLEQGQDAGGDRRGRRGAAVAVEIAGEMGDRAEVRLVRRQRGRPLTAVADELLVLVHRAHCDHPGVPVRAPDAPPGAGVAATPPVRTGAAAIAGGKQHDDPLVDRLQHLAGEGVVRVLRVVRRPALLEHAPAIGQDLRRAVAAMPVDRPLEGLKSGRQRVAVGNPQIIELGVRRHAEHIGAAHHAVVAPGGGRGPPTRGGPAADDPVQLGPTFARLDGPADRADAAVDDADDEAVALVAGRPDLVDAEIAGDVGDRAARGSGRAVAGTDRAGRHAFDHLEGGDVPGHRGLEAELGCFLGEAAERRDPAVAPNLHDVRLCFDLGLAGGVDGCPDDDRALAGIERLPGGALVAAATGVHRHRCEGGIDDHPGQARRLRRDVGALACRRPQLDQHPLAARRRGTTLAGHLAGRHAAERSLGTIAAHPGTGHIVLAHAGAQGHVAAATLLHPAGRHLIIGHQNAPFA